MPSKKPDQILLKKLFLLEQIGESFYEIMAVRERDGALKNIYERLRINESETKLLIQGELKNVYPNEKIQSQTIAISIFRFFCKILPLLLLKSLLRSTLGKRFFSKLSDEYRSLNPGFWDALARHEYLQHELLTPFWNKPSGG
ncbi:MAG TPA: hypothetical protein PKV84_01655 [Candidatus Omnitrophota bacterium]|nr:hypothetical protein [Candidatus Omnitrophota bacterium]